VSLLSHRVTAYFVSNFELDFIIVKQPSQNYDQHSKKNCDYITKLLLKTVSIAHKTFLPGIPEKRSADFSILLGKLFKRFSQYYAEFNSSADIEDRRRLQVNII
jgi:hypothetical protein